MGTPGLEGGIRKRAVMYLAGCLPYFFGTVKEECVYRSTFANRREARTALFDSLETFYNRTRRHSSLGYLSPLTYEQRSEAPHSGDS